MAGLKTCLVIHSQDPTADYILNCKIGTTPVTCNDNLSAVRLETTKVSSVCSCFVLLLFGSSSFDYCLLIKYDFLQC